MVAILGELLTFLPLEFIFHKKLLIIHSKLKQNYIQITKKMTERCQI